MPGYFVSAPCLRADRAGRRSAFGFGAPRPLPDRKSTRLNSSHSQISYAVFCLKKKNAHVTYDNHIALDQLNLLVSTRELLMRLAYVENPTLILYGHLPGFHLSVLCRAQASAGW